MNMRHFFKKQNCYYQEMLEAQSTLSSSLKTKLALLLVAPELGLPEERVLLHASSQ